MLNATTNYPDLSDKIYPVYLPRLERVRVSETEKTKHSVGFVVECWFSDFALPVIIHEGIIMTENSLWDFPKEQCEVIADRMVRRVKEVMGKGILAEDECKLRYETVEQIQQLINSYKPQEGR